MRSAAVIGRGESKGVSERLGHGSIAQTLDTYSHVLPTMQERAAAKLDPIFQATTAPKAVNGWDWLRNGHAETIETQERC
jgi:hypothetical protein